VAAPVESLEEIVRAELREPVAELVRRVVLDLAREEAEAQLARLGASLNGGPRAAAEMVLSGPQSPQDTTEALAKVSDFPRALEAARRLCHLCQKEKPAEAFERGRWQCRDCRRVAARRHYHERQARARSVVRAANGAEPEPPG
jgi:ribosomal protein L37AE/L43A